MYQHNNLQSGFYGNRCVGITNSQKLVSVLHNMFLQSDAAVTIWGEGGWEAGG